MKKESIDVQALVNPIHWRKQRNFRFNKWFKITPTDNSCDVNIAFLN